MIGKIIKLTGGYYYVLSDTIYETRARGLFRHQDLKPLVGDNVEFEVEENSLGYITKILERKNFLKRPPVANVDAVLILIAAKSPSPNTLLIDKVIAEYERENLEIIIGINKIDLDEEAGNKLYETYKKSGFKTFKISLKNSIGIEELHEYLLNKTIALSGVSAAGKSTLINKLIRGELKTGEISKKLNRGRHTTRHTEIFSGKNIYLFDTPGFSNYELTCPSEDLKNYFREFIKFGPCNFNNCNHIHEPKCIIREKVEEGKIDRQRYENYKNLYLELKEKEKNKYSW